MLPLAALAALFLVGINESAYDRSTAALTRLGERAQARAQVELIWRALIDAEAGQRGYLLTGQTEYLRPFEEAGTTVQQALSWLTAYYADDPEAAPILVEVRESSLGKLSELATTLQMHAQQQAWRDLLLTDIGRERMDGLRITSQKLLGLETRRIDTERDAIVRTLRNGRLGVNGMTALSLLALALFLRRTLALDRDQARHRVALQAQRDGLASEVTRRTADLTGLARHLQTAREEEKSHLARELHDELGALLTAAKLDAARLKRVLGTPSASAVSRLAHLNDSINRGIALKRRIIEDLRPSSLGNLGLVAALDILVRDFSARSEINVNADLQSVSLSDSAQITAFRLVQGVLANAVQHAAATLITVTLHPGTRTAGGPDGAWVAVRDNGRGFDTEQHRGTAHGLMGLRYRVESEAGLFEVDSKPGAGTHVRAWFPLAPAPQRGGALEPEAADVG